MSEEVDFIEKAIKLENGLVFQTEKGKLIVVDDIPRCSFSSRCRAVSARFKELDVTGVEKGWP
jgi:hypothetical protein